MFKDKTLPLPLGDFFGRASNRVEIQAQLPTAEDAACDPLAAIANNKRFLLLDPTAIRIPQLARIGRMPDLAVTASGGFRLSAERNSRSFTPRRRTIIRSPPPRRSPRVWRLRLAARSTSASPRRRRRSDRAPPWSSPAPTSSMSRRGTLSALIWNGCAPPGRAFRRSRRIPSPNCRQRTFAPAIAWCCKNLPAAWPFAARAGRGLPAAASIDLAALLAESTHPAGPPADRDLFEEWSEKLSGHERWRQWLKGAGASIGALAGAAWRGTMDEAQSLIANGDEEAAKMIYRRDNSLLIAQTARGAEADDVWTL